MVCASRLSIFITFLWPHSRGPVALYRYPCHSQMETKSKDGYHKRDRRGIRWQKIVRRISDSGNIEARRRHRWFPAGTEPTSPPCLGPRHGRWLTHLPHHQYGRANTHSSPPSLPYAPTYGSFKVRFSVTSPVSSPPCNEWTKFPGISLSWQLSDHVPHKPGIEDWISGSSNQNSV